MAKKKKKSAKKRISAALTRYLKRMNPAFKKAEGVRVKRLKGGGVSFMPVANVAAARKRRSSPKRKRKVTRRRR